MSARQYAAIPPASHPPSPRASYHDDAEHHVVVVDEEDELLLPAPELGGQPEGEVLQLGLQLSQQTVDPLRGERLVDTHQGGRKLGVPASDLGGRVRGEVRGSGEGPYRSGLEVVRSRMGTATATVETWTLRDSAKRSRDAQTSQAVP